MAAPAGSRTEHGGHSGGLFGSWFTNVRFFPGRNGDGTPPYGSCSATRLYSVHGWTTLGLESFDYGAVKLNCNVGNTVGWMGAWWQSAALGNLQATVAGYPGDKPRQQWRSTGRLANSDSSQVFYPNDSIGGMSGGPVYQVGRTGAFCQGTCAFAIHTQGLHGLFGKHANYNHGTRLTQSIYTNLSAWRNAPQ